MYSFKLHYQQQLHMAQTLAISSQGFLRIAERLNSSKDKQLVKTLRIENIIPATIKGNDSIQTYHYQVLIQYLLKEVVPKFANALAEFSNLQELKLIMRMPLLEKNGFDYLVTVINEKLAKLKKIELYLLVGNVVTNEANNWTTKLGNNVECKCL